MTYSETLDWLWAHLPMYQEKGNSAFRPKLDNILMLCEHLGRPQEQFPSVHIAGTNGKGSSSHAIASVLQEAGYKVGLYTSPHLKDFRERIKINGKDISQEDVIAFVEKNKDFLEAHSFSFFEVSVAMAFDYFSKLELLSPKLLLLSVNTIKKQLLYSNKLHRRGKLLYSLLI